METLSGDLFTKYADFVYQISGMRFNEAKAYYLSSKVTTRMQALVMANYEEYYRFLQTAQAKASEHTLLMNEVTINETFFFRNQPQLKDFEEYVLKPVLAAKRAQGKNKIRIWSCAASTGDEAYTTAFQCMGLPEAQSFSIEIIGTDISRQAINKAQEGIYTKYAIRNIPQDLMQRCFAYSEKDDNYHINDEIKRMVKFQEGNLMDTNRIRMQGQFDIIFCRNVLIYFDDESKIKVLNNISSALLDTGYLLVGHSENLYPQRDIFRQCKDMGQSLAYQKTEVVKQANLARLGI
jgi:chemotaxis protein methyltransferase CheR